MFKTLITPLLASLALVSVPAFAAPALSTGMMSSVNASTSNGNTQNIRLSCSAGNFRGEVTGYVKYSNQDSSKYFIIEKYRITKLNGQKGGNKANINTTTERYSKKSPDSMNQNGEWHDLHHNGFVNSYNVPLTVEFIFDKSGSDPRCTDTLNI